FRESSFDLRDATTDGAGRATLVIDPRNGETDSSRPLRLRAAISAVEPGGRAVSDDVRIPYRPNDRYVGVKSAFEDSSKEGEAARFDVISLDGAGARKAAEINWRL